MYLEKLKIVQNNRLHSNKKVAVVCKIDYIKGYLSHSWHYPWAERHPSIEHRPWVGEKWCHHRRYQRPLNYLGARSFQQQRKALWSQNPL